MGVQMQDSREKLQGKEEINDMVMMMRLEEKAIEVCVIIFDGWCGVLCFAVLPFFLWWFRRGLVI